MSLEYDRPMVLSVHQAFVVQFTSDTQIAAGRIAGRVEHFEIPILTTEKNHA